MFGIIQAEQMFFAAYGFLDSARIYYREFVKGIAYCIRGGTEYE